MASWNDPLILIGLTIGVAAVLVGIAAVINCMVAVDKHRREVAANRKKPKVVIL